MTLFLYAFAVIITILLPVGLAIALRRRVRVPWYLFLVGCATFLLSQAVHLPLNDWLGNLGLLPKTGLEGLPLWRISLTLGLTAGLCEELMRAVSFALLRRARAYNDGVMLGLGHGGIEAMLLGGVLLIANVSALIPYIGKDLSSMDITYSQMVSLQQQLAALENPGSAFMPLLERCLAMTIHVVCSLIVWKAFASRRYWLIGVAVLYHALIDAVAVYAAQSLDNVWLVFGCFTLAALPGIIWAWLIRPKDASTHIHQSLWAEFRLFITATGKELLYQWRTSRVLIILVVFCLFGLTSPVLAYFTPEILKSIQGAEQFASLIPSPTVADAYLQYIKNMSQFGFILAVLLGMGAVAGEKESGTAVMVLSKPLPRWAFLLSKFTAQVLVYLGAFILAGMGAGFYTWYLFAELDAAGFALVNVLLFAWLLPFVAITLLGSAWGKSTGAAAGIGLGGSVLLMLLGSIPQYGQIFPGALATWAQAVSSGVAAPPNGGALAVSLVVVVLSLLGALAVFEKQEL
ncbi:MAG TPA: YhfC family glutamic-type intramembrane protease [Anaerolineaceae bacterium]|nr:YhfC family glutamic-type intramembrane protease [Anaerolineaceae bacterium]HPN50583.1 YhfC family glutamic-type intramembrane protease [Anaerolineaceae bacterium]